ncbi:MAG: Ig-like domain-containing protein [Actinomycetota bacterium]
MAGAPIGAIPIGAIDLAASPIGAIPIGAIPIGAIGSMVDCSLIDCDPAAGFTLADAQEAGALQSTATVAGLDGITDSGVTFDDLVGLDGIDEATLRAAIDAQTSVGTLADFQTYDAMVLAELPASQTASTTLEQLGDALATVSLADFLAATDDIDETGLRAELTTEGVNNLADLPNYDGIELGDLPASDAQFQAQTLDALLPAMENIRLGDILDYHATLTGNDVDWGTATLADLSAWEDVTLEELATYNGTTLADLITDLVGNGTEGDLTFGDVLLSLVGTEAHDWADVDLGALELESTGSPITITSSFEIDGNSSIARTLQITTTIPLDAQYVPGSAALTEISTTLTPSGFGEPTINGNELTWTLSGAGVGGEYQVSIDIIPSLSLGTSTVSTTGRLAASGVESTAIGSVGIAQAFEPNDNVGDSGVLTAVSDTIYASHIATEDDVDLFRVDLAAGSRLAASLSDLPADFDLVVYGPPAVPVSDQPALRQINPTEPPEVTLEAAANQSGGAVLQDVPLQDLPVIAVSNNRDNAGESIDIQSVRSTGTYYIQVSGYSGATSADPYALFVKTVDPPAPLVCAAQSYQSAANTGSLPSAAALAGVNTLILVNQERLFGKYGTDANTALTALNDLVTYTNTTNPGLGITAAIVPVDGDANVRAAYNDLDSAACEPDKANAVVREINRVIDDMRDLDPNTEITQIMIAGDDDIIPMARLADDTTIANESGYAQTFLGTEANSYFGALVNSMYLSDEPYGDVDPIQSGERILYVTDVALGRLVERPDEIAGQVVAFIASGGQLDPSTSYVSGYDFLDDGAQAVADELAALPDTTSVVTEISETWTAADVIADLFPATGPSPQVASINAHYDHYRALPADENAAGTENDLFTTADVDDPTRANLLTGRILSSMGCHGGLHVPDELFGSTTDPRALDWAQVYARQAATWVGNTGYGYGETEGVELSERLMALYAANLDGSVTVGEALFYAKQTYLGTQQAEYGPFDEKVLQEATFYGIPFYQISVATPPAPAPLPPQPTTVPVAGTSLDLTTIQSDPTLVATATAGQGTSYEAVLPAGDPGVPDQQSTPFAPIEPTVSYDVSFVGPDGEPERIAQGAIITGLTTDDVGGIDPDIALPIVDDSTVETEPDVGDINTDPAVFVSSFETPEGPRQSVTSLLGTFTSDQPDGSGTQRLFEELTLDVYYRDPAASADQTRPIFDDVEGTIASGVLTIEATVNDDQPDNVIRVLALVVQDAASDTVWTPVELVDLGSGRWSGSLVVTGTEIEYLVQAVDGSGNTALTTNKSRLFVEDPTPPPPDPTITVTASAAPANDPYYNAPVTLTATADGQPIDYRIDGGAIVTAGTTANVLLDPGVLGDGAVTVEFTSGNAQRTETILFDTTSPVVEITSPVDGATYDSATPIPVAFSCADAASGIASCDALLNGAPVTPGDVTLAAGSYTLTLNGSDTVGNSASPVSVTFTVEDGAPPADPLMIEMLNVDGVAAIGEEVEVLIDFTGSGSPHSVTIDWGDGTSCTAPGSDPNCVLTEPTVDDPGTVEAWHTYNANGVVDVTITLTSSNNETITEVVTLKSCTITGTNGNDTLFGTQGDDVICGRGGNDRIVGRGGNDVLVGGKGNDRLEGGRGDDILLGNRGNDRLWGGAGEDVLRGGRDNDRLDGQGNADKLSGGSGADRLNGGGGNDELRGGKGRDVLIGSSGDDLMIGGRDADQLNGGGGKDTMYGRGGPDLLIGGNADDELRGGGGDDDLRGGGGADELIGGSGNDRCRGNGGNNTLVSCER